jgi:lysyl-tRNA synthetase class II
MTHGLVALLIKTSKRVGTFVNKITENFYRRKVVNPTYEFKTVSQSIKIRPLAKRKAESYWKTSGGYNSGSNRATTLE